MKISIRYQCHGCGAWTTSTGHATWPRCAACHAVLGFDWLALHQSPEYQRWLVAEATRAQAAAGQYSDDYVQSLTRADAAAAAGDLDACRQAILAASELAVTSFPYLYPPDVATDPAYRQAHVARGAWSLWQQRVDPEVRETAAELSGLAVRLSVEDPLPVLMSMAAVVERQARRLDQLATAPETPPDPDQRPPDSRLRLMLTFALGGYLPFLTPEHQVTVLERIHGRDNVAVDMDPGEVELTTYADWQCPACSMLSMQPRNATVALCPACGYRLPLSPSASTELIQGVPGLLVTDDNRQELVLAGLGRIASIFSRMIGPRRFARLVRGSLPGLGDPERAALLDQVLALSRREGGDHMAAVLIEGARAVLHETAREPALAADEMK